tara:strand:- start:262 stop:384 length:123 start_codon:yes stop_codon:yes gene_type:complete
VIPEGGDSDDSFAAFAALREALFQLYVVERRVVSDGAFVD